MQDELSFHRELEQLPVLLAVTGEPDEVVIVDENPVLALGPFVAQAETAPVADEVARLIKDEDRGSGDAALRFGRVLLGGTLSLSERARPMHDPDTLVFVRGDARDLPQYPIVREHLRPERIDLELR